MAEEATQKRGLFIVLEGLDGAGLSTQAALLRSGLAARDIPAVATKEPTSGPIGAVIRQALSHRFVYPPAEPIGDDVMALLLAADRLDHIRADILPRLEGGTHVICDRYRLSSYAYQGSSLEQEWVRTLNNRSLDPDVTFFIDVPVEICCGRIASRGSYVELYEGQERLSRVYANYQKLIKEFREKGERIINIDGTLPIGIVAASILDKTLQLIGHGKEPEPPEPRKETPSPRLV